MLPARTVPLLPLISLTSQISWELFPPEQQPPGPSAQGTAVPFLLAPHVCPLGGPQIRCWPVAAGASGGLGKGTRPHGDSHSSSRLPSERHSPPPRGPTGPTQKLTYFPPIYPHRVCGEPGSPDCAQPRLTSQPFLPASWACRSDLLVQCKRFPKMALQQHSSMPRITSRLPKPFIQLPRCQLLRPQSVTSPLLSHPVSPL